MNRKTLVITDNTYAKSLAEELNTLFGDVDIAQSQAGQLKEVSRIDVSQVARSVIEKYDLVISIHCKQMFPKHLIDSVRCINVHPGFNPYNRGWYPQVFSIIDGSASGVTIHEIDELLDHGKIIVQKKIELTEWDTSGSAYKKIMQAERQLLLEWFQRIRDEEYVASTPHSEGNLNLKKDFDGICEVQLDEIGPFRCFLDRLRALTHQNHRNAYFISKTGKKVFLSLQLELEE